MAIELTEPVRAFTREPHPAVIGTKRRDGSIQLNPVWYEYRDGQIWLNAAHTRRWLEHLRRDPETTIYVQDGSNMWRWMQLQGRVVEIAEQGGAEHIDRLSERYTGNPVYQNHRPDEQRVIVKIDPVRVTGTLDDEA